MKRKLKSRQNKIKVMLIALAVTVIGVLCLLNSGSAVTERGVQAQNSLSDFGGNKKAYLASLPKNIRELYEKNPDTKDFVFSYNELIGTKSKVDLSEYKNSKEVPLFMQWDKRWGYMDYSGDCVAITGCGPVCLSMVAFYLTGDKDMSPDKMVEFATRNGYYQRGFGSLWTLISEGGKKLGITVKELPLSESMIIENLKAGKPIICVMGKGDFTSSGHFIVMRKYEKGKIWVNDPNSFENSEKGWEYDRIKSQIKNLWACSA
ncbi:MAG: C39 family peptidase [Acutalibacteraceae bacterium]|nr:C39 family peptidase [Acutalibacteraceae bacterium]